MCGKKDRDIKIGENWQIKDCERTDFYWDCEIKQQEIVALFYTPYIKDIKMGTWFISKNISFQIFKLKIA